jgi:hypothetical protein
MRLGSLVRLLSEKQASEQIAQAKEDEDYDRDYGSDQPHHLKKL